ncbi:hypothetical protein SLE2022_033970 [Rubroshorea leprosula]
MAAPISSIFLAALLLLLCVLPTFELRELTAESYHHTLQVSSLLPSSVCSTYEGLDKMPSSLKVVHKHGPCSNLHQKESSAPTHAELLLQDQGRVNSIHSRLANSGDKKKTDATTLPAYHGSTIGTDNYIVTVGLGTPRTDLSLMFDTGSDITWTQCEPCVSYCYKQKEPIFDPSKSASYLNIPCASSICRSLPANSSGCSSSTCVYAVHYGDSSYTIGFFAKERLTLTSTDVFDTFLFGCGENNRGLFRGAAGLLGLGRNKFSFPSQTAQKYNKLFSYCLPSSASSTGYLTFGNSGISSSVKFTPSPKLGETFYGLNIIGISVGGNRLSISPSVFYNAGTIIDSGTVITRLPPTAYSALRTAFRQGMSTYPNADALGILDTCYDFSNYDAIRVPRISIFFSGGVQVDINISGVFFAADVSQVCLAFAGNSDDSHVGIFGNVQQKTFQVVYDNVGGRVGFAAGGCR